MFRSKLTLALVALAAVAVAIPAISLAGNNTTEVGTKMKGKYVVPGDGAPKGKVELDAFVKPTQEKLCFTFEAHRLDMLTGGVIAKAPEGDAAKAKITFFDQPAGVDGEGSFEGCVKNVKENLLQRIADSPEKFYAQIASLDYPDGAVRGQLKLADDTQS